MDRDAFTAAYLSMLVEDDIISSEVLTTREFIS
jgi:hypothetical protein